MALSYKARRRWSLVILLVGLPLYIVVAISIVALLDRPPVLVELGIYIILGILWALPFKSVFRGIGQADPDAAKPDEENRPDA
ncbi:DUF2842 domain-containing protein [Oceanomicrobium pacificus]|uniref:DUF2842 domain-containing protein n=1 Tax=Oceanomicrobium pacificus TaxID=2692916 RepID=A0A6B0TVF2_9RHOB|nr:DUF2842 domain-containing protein [Oceanomicrobium pacificus]MXU65528.1 DUF2842 domain-containing protein [Oceanomicrobium pacificus]